MFSTDRFKPAYPDVSGTDQETLRDQIVKRFDDNELTSLLTFKCNVDWKNQIPNANYPDRVYALIQTLNRVGQLHWLVLLVTINRPGCTPLEEILARLTPPTPADRSWPDENPQPVAAAAPQPVVTAKPAAAPQVAAPQVAAPQPTSQVVDPWNRVLLGNNRPFLDRQTFRAECKLVGLGGSRPILSVVGPQDSGKSYTAGYLLDVTKELDDNPLVTREVRLDRLNGVAPDGASTDVDGLRLARRLADVMTEKALPPYIVDSFGSEQDPTWAADAASWLSTNALSPPLRWIIFDGFQSTVLSPSAHSLVNSLLDEVSREPKIRIGLLGYRGALGWCADAVREVHLDLENFKDEERLKGYVLSYLLEVSKEAQARGLPPFTTDDVLAHTPKVLGQIDPSAPNLHDLEAALTEIAERALVGVP